jgi:hypothetical protein
MTVIAPPEPPSQDELEALIKEARARQLQRRLIGATFVAIATALSLGIYALLTGSSHAKASGRPGVASPPLCRSEVARRATLIAGSVVGSDWWCPRLQLTAA